MPNKLSFRILILLVVSTQISVSQIDKCFTESRDIILGNMMPYTLVEIGSSKGYYVVDFGTTGTTIDLKGFINEPPTPVLNTTNNFEPFIFFGSWGKVNLKVQDHTNIILPGFKQAGLLGTDFLSLNTFMLDYTKNKLYRTDAMNFCSDEKLKEFGFEKVSTLGYYSNDLSNLTFNKPNIPTIPIKIAGVEAVAQIDPGFDDYLSPNAININQAYYNKIINSGIRLIPNIEKDNVLTTCTNSKEQVKAYKLPQGRTFEITGVNDKSVVIDSTVNIFLKKTPADSKICGGIGTWDIPAAQLGASFLRDAKQVIFDPFKSVVWFQTK